MAPDETFLKTKQVASALGVSVSTVKRWVDTGALNAKRTLGKHRLIPLSEAKALARRLGLSLARIEACEKSPTEFLEVIDDPIRDRLADALREGDSARADALIQAVVASGLGAVALADDLIRPVMAGLGDYWRSGKIDVFQERQATQIVCACLARLIDRAAAARVDPGPLAIGATPGGDVYQIPLLLGELVLREAGWAVRSLGPNLPLRSLARALKEYRPSLVFLSISHLEDAEGFTRDYNTFFEAAVASGAAVVLGGRALGPELRAKLVYASYGDRMAHLGEFARRLIPRPADGKTGV